MHLHCKLYWYRDQEPLASTVKQHPTSRQVIKKGKWTFGVLSLLKLNQEPLDASNAGNTVRRLAGTSHAHSNAQGLRNDEKKVGLLSLGRQTIIISCLAEATRHPAQYHPRRAELFCVAGLHYPLDWAEGKWNRFDLPGFWTPECASECIGTNSMLLSFQKCLPKPLWAQQVESCGPLENMHQINQRCRGWT